MSSDPIVRVSRFAVMWLVVTLSYACVLRRGYPIDGGHDVRRAVVSAAVPKTGLPLLVFNYVADTDLVFPQARDLVNYIVACGGVDITQRDFSNLERLLRARAPTTQFNLVIVTHGLKGGHTSL